MGRAPESRALRPRARQSRSDIRSRCASLWPCPGPSTAADWVRRPPLSARSLLDAIAKRVIYTGGIGTVSIAKIMHNSASFTFDLVMAECWTAGIKAGIDAATIVKVFNEVAFG